MNKIEVGDLVKHKEYGFEGVVITVEKFGYTVRINKAKHPFGENFTEWYCDKVNLILMVKNYDKYVVGAKVFHPVHGFEGEIVSIGHQFNSGNRLVKVLITKGANPIYSGEQYYDANTHALMIIDEDKTEELSKKYNTNGCVDFTLPDGSTINFEYHSDFMDFITKFSTFNK